MLILLASMASNNQQQVQFSLDNQARKVSIQTSKNALLVENLFVNFAQEKFMISFPEVQFPYLRQFGKL